MNKIEAPQLDRLEQQVGVAFPLFDHLAAREKVASWAKEVLSGCNGLPKGNNEERKIPGILVTKTAAQLLENPQDISIADMTWRKHEVGENHAQESKEPFSYLVRKKCLAFIKDKWEVVKPEQLAELVRIYADINDPYQYFAKKMLTNYFDGPESRDQRVHAYYNFVSGVLDLAGEDEAFIEGMKIALHATDILPKDPGLTEQAVLLSLPYKEDPDSFRMALVANFVIEQLRFIGMQDLREYYEERIFFVETPRVQNKLSRHVQHVTSQVKKQQRTTDKEAENFTDGINDKMLFFFSTIRDTFLTENRKQTLMERWPFDVAFNDPLNQKFNRILAENRSNSGARVELGLV